MIKAYLEKGNQWLEEKFIVLGIKKRPMSELEKILPQYIQSFVLNVQSGLTVDQALIVAAENTRAPQALLNEFSKRETPSIALSYYAREENASDVNRFVRLIEQNKKTGGTNIHSILQQFSNEILLERFEAFKQKSEKVSVKLTFLLSLSLISVIIVTIAPVMLA